MDHFGIGAAMRGMALTYSFSARHTGRTTSLVESVKDGDRILFDNPREAERVRRLILERGPIVQCFVVDPRKPDSFTGYGTPQGRSIFDHSWVESYYLAAIERAQREIDHFEREASGHGATHRETKRKAVELAKWNF